ncbi:S8 family serine peptidase [Staphylospora marina]|uniref:S8 family serine peptidase n=1 Tax=Staphylospora marina TaxID=2490858 RepID=UPI001F14BB95|nr:S8 family serine peptidase [Staphylospora marina]
MKKKFTTFFLFLLCLVLAVPAISLAAPSETLQSAEDVPDEIIVKWKAGVSATSAKSAVSALGGKTVRKYDGPGFEVVKVARGTTAQTLEKLKKHPLVEYAEPNHILHALGTPNDPQFSAQWYLEKIEAPKAWDITESHPGIKIAIVDTGVDLTHPDLAAKIVGGWDFVDNDAVPQDGNGHGTGVAGVAAAITHNAVGIAGTAPRASILPVRVLDNSGSGTVANVVAGIRYAADQGAQVINISLGSSIGSTALQQAIQYAWNKGSVLVAAAGASGSTAPTYPAAYPEVIAVACTTQNDTLCSFSNYGSWVDVGAPGVNITTTVPGGYATYSGTSYSAGIVSGVAALLAGQGRSNANIVQTIISTGDPISGVTFKRVNAYRAVIN